MARSKPYRRNSLEWPVTQRQWESLNAEIDALYRRLNAVSVEDITDPAALTKTDDTNVTLTLTGTPESALLHAVKLVLGWTGLLAPARGGTGLDTSGVAKGGLLVGSAAGTWALKTVGSDDQVLTADAASAGGVKWATGGISAAKIETYVSLKVL